MNYYIQGNKDKADQIMAAFKAKGCVMHTGIQCDLSDMVYFSLNGKVGGIKLRNLDLFKTHYDIANFHAGMPVLVREGICCEWRYTIFSHHRKNGTPFCASGIIWHQCIPFEGNEHLLGTTDMCDEQYINW